MPQERHIIRNKNYSYRRMEFYQALIIGIVGSFHCAGMCGPIAIALPLKEDSWGTRLFSALLYNSGRITTYAFLGMLFGFLGFGLAFWGMQRYVSILAGSIMILSVLFPFVFRSVHTGSMIEKVLKGFRGLFGKYLGIRTFRSLFFIGLLNGLLPCGLVYIALAGAVVSNGPVEGSVNMLFFGLGTLPIMLFVSIAGNIITLKFRNKIKKIIPLVIVLIGVLFILRGLDLGIPYISPKLVPNEQLPHCCH